MILHGRYELLKKEEIYKIIKPRLQKRSALSERDAKFVGLTRQEIFTKVYQNNLWGKSKDPAFQYYSGDGSTIENSLEYINLINSFILKHNIKMIVDCGCGDFKVASNFRVENYIGVDICKELIEYNNEKFANTNVKFLHLDIVEDEIPGAELCLIRQVFQHLSNSDIQKVLSKLDSIKYVIISDEISRRGVKVNEDIPTSCYLRKKGLYLESPPFNRKIKVLLQTFTNYNGIIRTLLIVNEKIPNHPIIQR
ncbi:MAG: class I SAM-dependent methyltransferase [Candidatus Hodarchaeota archaeon]